MEEQKVIITKSDYDINLELEKGWLVKSVTAQHIAVGSGQFREGQFLEGQFLVVLYKPLEIL